MISFHDMRRAMDKLGITMSNLQLNNLMNEVLPNPQAGLSVGGVEVWGDEKSIREVRNWNYAATTLPHYMEQARAERGRHSASIKQWREQVDANQRRAIRAEELGLRLLNELLNISAGNPASAGYSSHAAERLAHLNLEPREGFFHSEEAALADAREKFYDAAHPRR